METNFDLDSLIANAGTIAVEVGAIVFTFVVLNWIFKRTVLGIIATPALARWQGVASKIRTNLRLLLVMLAIPAILAVIGANLYLLYLGKFLPDYTLEMIRGIPRQFWIDIGISLAKILGLVLAAAIVLRLLRRLLDFTCDRAKAFEGIHANNDSIDKFFGSLSRTVSIAVWLIVLATAAAWIGLPASVYSAIVLALRIFLIVAIGILIWRALGALIESADALSNKYLVAIEIRQRLRTPETARSGLAAHYRIRGHGHCRHFGCHADRRDQASGRMGSANHQHYRHCFYIPGRQGIGPLPVGRAVT